MSEITRRDFVKGAAFAPFAISSITSAQTSTLREDHFDFVIAGAGHNSLITAAYLCMAGFKVVVLEGRPEVGGGVKTAELLMPGFWSDVCSSTHNAPMRANPAIKNNELRLGDYGLEYIFADPVKHVPFLDGSYLTEWQDLDRTCSEIAKYSKKDADAYRKMALEFSAVRHILQPEDIFTPVGWQKQSPAAASDKLPPSKLAVWRRRMTMRLWDALHDQFEDERTMTFVMAPWPVATTSYNTGIGAWPPNKPDWACPKGGSGMLAVALARCIEAHGGVILLNNPVTQLIIESGKCVGVECSDGSSYRAAKGVVSTLHIKRLVGLAPRELWGDDFLESVRLFYQGIAGFNTHYATTEPLKFPVAGGTLSPVNITSLQSPDRALRYEYEMAAGLVDYDEPVLHVVQSSVIDPLRAPEGYHVIRILAQEPWDLKEGGYQAWESIKDKAALAHLRFMQRLAPNLTDDKILARFITTPVHIEEMNPGMYHGACHGGADGPAQAGAMRPVLGWADYRMPIQGLYQTGTTTYPSGGVTGAPGRNCAMVLLKEFGSSIEEAVAKGNKA
jgi:phytoene dehydrogenase-like protein